MLLHIPQCPGQPPNKALSGPKYRQCGGWGSWSRQSGAVAGVHPARGFPSTCFGRGFDAVVRGEKLGTPQLPSASSFVGRCEETSAFEDYGQGQARPWVSTSHRRVFRADASGSRRVGRSTGFGEGGLVFWLWLTLPLTWSLNLCASVSPVPVLGTVPVLALLTGSQ